MSEKAGKHQSTAEKWPDHFSGHAAAYARFRPKYPRALFQFLAMVARDRGLAWDCGTGNGQAATGLAEYFDGVVATDRSLLQLSEAPRNDRVRYWTANEHQSGIRSGSVDLVTVAQALHWFDIDAFFREAARVGRHGAVVAVWCYTQPRIHPAVNAIIDAFYQKQLQGFWPPQRRHVDTRYRDLAFPFESVATPSFEIIADLNRPALLAYIRTWSAVRRYREAHGVDPVDLLDQHLRFDWPADESRTVVWPIGIRVGRVRNHGRPA